MEPVSDLAGATAPPPRGDPEPPTRPPGRRPAPRPGLAAAPPPARHGPARARERWALVDASNVAHNGEGGAPRLDNLLLVRQKLVEEGFHPLIVADAALRHQIDRPEEYQRLVHEGTIHQAPAGTDADFFLLSFARELGASVVSNDRFRDGGAQFEPVRQRLIRYMVVAGHVVFERRGGRRDR